MPCEPEGGQVNLVKRTPLTRKVPLKAASAGAPSGGKRRARLAPVSERRRRVNAERARVLEEHFGPRATWRCAMRDDPAALATFGPCLGPVAGHEVVSRAASGRTDVNLLDVRGIILLCAQHNGAVEDNPQAAFRMGYKRHAWEDDDGRTR